MGINAIIQILMQNKTYQHIFFDLDRTLWDFNANSDMVLQQLFREYGLVFHFGSFVFFKNRFEYHNSVLWNRYYRNGITKEKLVYQRFYITLKEAGYDNLEVAKKIAVDYLKLSPLQTKLIPFTLPMLQKLKERGYQLHIITNGFNEVQFKKIENCNLGQYFTQIITSEDAGANKPSKQIFEYALNRSNATPQNSLMIGDDLNTDIAGAANMGIDQIYFNYFHQKHEEQPTYEVTNLLEVLKII